MDIPEQSNDPILDKFDKWLKNNRLEPRANMLEAVRESLQDSPSPLDQKIDALFKQDSSLFDEQLTWKIRGRLAAEERQQGLASTLARWLAPVAAAATLALAIISFQSQGDKPVQQQAGQPTVDNLALVEGDEDLMQILALAANLDSAGDVTKLEAAGNLSFLFE